MKMAVKHIDCSSSSKAKQDQICENVQKEIETMKQLNHKNIVQILGATKTGISFYLFLELMSGGSVSDLLQRDGKLSLTLIRSYAHQVLLGLVYLHDNRTPHRDLKGELTVNLLGSY
jgi:serine/threonine protein kinase